MARKTFISYKYSESQDLRNRILDALEDDAQYYKGETSDSPDLTDTTTETIKRNLSNMIYGTSVTIIIASPNMHKSKWIDWEISYSLKAITRSDRTSQTNGVICVIKKISGSYDWIKSTAENKDGCYFWTIDNKKLYPIIHMNRFNKNNLEYICDNCQTINDNTQSYISIITEDEFLVNPNNFIENAYEKSKNINDYKIQKEI